MQIKPLISSAIKEAFNALDLTPKTTEVSDATKAQFGDFQYNGAMALAKELKTNPREIAQNLANVLKTNNIFDKVEVAGPGFINLTIAKSFLQDNILNSLNSRAGVEKKSNPIKVVVDYSSPNMAKQMHVGHLRSTVIGDSIANLFEFLGDEVIRQNHIGDWGTQFGMLIAYFEEHQKDASSKLSDLEQFYKEAKKHFDASKDFANKARDYVVKLQSGDKACLKLWQEFINKTMQHCQSVYDDLNVSLNSSHVRGESAYNDKLCNIVQNLQEQGIAKESQGAVCVFFEDSDNPLIIQKQDGGYLYATTDLAAIDYRVNTLGAKRVCYVVDARQGEHFKQVFATAKKANIAHKDTLLEHIAFGMVLDKSGKPFKTRDGSTVKLQDLINEAIQRAKEVIKSANTYTKDELQEVAKAIGVGSLKYADLSINRQSNYIFDWDKMLSLDGNTALYMQYAYARINSILTKAGDFEQTKPQVSDELERRLALKVLSLEDRLNKAYQEAMPHLIATYLYELAGLFMKFYENNPILKENVTKETKNSRLILAKATANAIKVSLNILGIKALDKI